MIDINNIEEKSTHDLLIDLQFLTIKKISTCGELHKETQKNIDIIKLEILSRLGEVDKCIEADYCRGQGGCCEI